jgi:hypothetical protein
MDQEVELLGQVQVAHARHPSYSGGRDQEDCGLKPARENSSRDPILKKTPSQKKGWWGGSRWWSCIQTPILQEKKRTKKM